MAAEIKKEIQLEIAHVLFIDIVGYSKLSINDQRAEIDELTQAVRASEQFQNAEAGARLIKIPTGDGMALVFYKSPEEPVECALEISRALKEHPRLQLRMGVHSGPVSGVIDVNGHANLAGAGLNMAQRVMGCGDAGHILLTRHVTEDLEGYEQWRPFLHDLGFCEVKHGVKLQVVNLCTDEAGNRALPAKLRAQRQAVARTRWILVATSLGLLAAVVAAFVAVSRHAPRSSSAITEKSIAVLPFQNLSSDKENAYFTDGVQDEILTHLAKVADLKVISRTSVMQYKDAAKRNLREIAGALGVAHVLEGSVQRATNRVRVNAQLIDARSDAHLWAETYDRDLADVFAIQSEIAKTIADHLQARLSPSEKVAIEKPPTKNLAAYDLYLRARELHADTGDAIRGKEQLPKAADFLNQAVVADPEFVLAWSYLSEIHGMMYFWGHDHTPARLALANTAAQTALRLQPEAGEPHLALAMYYYRGFRDYDRARSELAIARKTLPNSAAVFLNTGTLAYRSGQWEEATRNLERAVELDPRNVTLVQQLALCYQPQRRYADEARMWEKALLITGDRIHRMDLALVEFNSKADIKPWQTTFAAWVAEDPSVAADIDHPYMALCERTASAAARALANYPPEGFGQYGINIPRAYWEAVVARWQGDAAKAQAAFATARGQVEEVLEEQPDFPAALSLLGMIDAGLGRKEEAIREGRRACERLPMSKDAVDGVAFAVNLAQIYAWVGEKDRAIEQLAAPLKVPNDLHYGELRLHPLWDPLRGDPRFEKLMEDAKKPFGL